MEQLNIKVMVITFEPVTLSITESEMPFSYYVDEQRRLYKYYGILKAGFWDLWGGRSLWAYLRLLGKGRKVVKSHGDIYQRGGDVLVDPCGKIQFHHIGDGPADRPDLETIFNRVENIDAG
jgi:hypothetical protein